MNMPTAGCAMLHREALQMERSHFRQEEKARSREKLTSGALAPFGNSQTQDDSTIETQRRKTE
jgi:hypothetical protein